MAAKKLPGEGNREHLYVSVEQTERKVIPAVQLERREIKMTFSPHDQPLSSAVTGVDQQKNTERIVGKESPKAQVAEVSFIVPKVIASQPTIKEEKSSPTESRSRSPQKKEVPHENVLEFFEEQGKTFQEQTNTLAPKARKDRSASPSQVRQSVGLDHLDNLVKLMEQLSQLKDENEKLKKKCDYLESTKTLLQAKSAVETEITIPSGFQTLPAKTKKYLKDRPRTGRPRLPSAEDIDILDHMESYESSSDTCPKRRKHAQIHKRSFSTGSLEIPSDIMEQSGEDDIQDVVMFNKNGKMERKIPKSPSGKRKSKISNWTWIKRVLSHKKLPEDIGFSLKSLGKIGGNIRVSSGSTKELSVPVSQVENRSVDSGVGSGVEADSGEGAQRKSTSGEVTLCAQQGGETGSSPTKMNLEELASEIWMGPPEWLEEHEEEMGNLSDPIENKEVIVLKSSAGKQDQDDNLLQVPMPRRKSSPSLLEHDDTDEEEDIAAAEEYMSLRRASSDKGRSSAGEIIQLPTSPKTSPKKLRRSKLSKMKYMVRTRKDSVKRKLSKRSVGHSEVNEGDMEGYDFDDSEGPLGRSTPKTSPLTMRQKSVDTKLPLTWISHMGTTIDVSSLMGGMSDDFSKKMQQWEDLKTKRSSGVFKDSSDVSDGVFSSDSFGTVSPEFQKKMDDWERSKSIKSTSSQKMLEEKKESELPGTREGSPDGTSTPLEVSIQSINVEDMQKKLSDSFSRKMEEWERQKYRKDSTSPTLDRKDSTGRLIKKDDRQKLRKSKVEKDKEKLEKRQRERDMQRVEREQQKLEKDKIRIEKERLRALEREARIQKMKGRLSQPEMESKFKSPILAPLAEYKVTTDFAKKLHEWEMRKGISSVSMATYYESQLRQAEQVQQADYLGQKDSDDDMAWNEGKKVKGQKPPPLALQPCDDSPEETSPGARSSEVSFDDETSITTESMTENNIKSLESANQSLVEELHAKELEYEALQEEVKDLSDKVNSARVQHSKETDQYKKELVSGGASAQMPKLTQEMSSKLNELETKIQELQSFGDNLAQKMESAAMCKWQSIEGEESVTTRLVELLEKMRLMLYKASHTEELSQKSSALYTFEKLYSQAMQLQVQLTNLRLSQLERNKEIVSMKRQLLLQEANNLLLQADIARRETELHWHKQHARRGMPIKRWNTYGGMEGRVVEGQETECIPPYKRFAQSRKEPVQPAVETEEMETQELNQSDEAVTDDSTIVKSVEPPTSPVEIQHKSCIYFPMRKFHEPHRSHFSKEMSLEIPFVDQEQEDSVRVLPDSKEGQVIRGEKGVEISLTIKLPTANINLPRDFSQQELNVPRSSRPKENDEIEINESTVQKSEAKISELHIPGKSVKGKLEKECSIELSDLELQIEPSKGITSVSKSESQVKRESDISMGSDSVFVESLPSEQKRKIIPVRVTQLSKSDLPSHTVPQQETHRETITLSPKLLHKPLKKPPTSPKSPTSPRYTAPITDKTFNWPKVRHVSYTAHRIKPADELLEESKRYRKGHSAYMSRILQKYKTDESRKFLIERQKSQDKENIAEGYVQAIVKRLSREGTPDITGDSTPKHLVSYRADSPQGRSEFVQQIVKKLSSPVDQTRSQSSPLKDVTNGIPKKVKKLTEVFDSGSTRNTPERALSDSESQSHKPFIVTSKSKDRTSQSVSYDSSSSTSTLTSVTEITYHPESAPINYSSMPLLTVKEEEPTDLQQLYRERAATTTTCAADQGVRGQSEKQEILVTITPWQQVKSRSAEISHAEQSSSHQPSSSKHSEVKLTLGQKPGKVKKETIGALCQQSMLSFDLGLSLQASEQVQYRKDSEADSGYSGKSPRPLSSESEGEPSASSEEKRKPKSKFFESHWFHKPKKFFKVSKC